MTITDRGNPAGYRAVCTRPHLGGGIHPSAALPAGLDDVIILSGAAWVVAAPEAVSTRI